MKGARLRRGPHDICSLLRRQEIVQNQSYPAWGFDMLSENKDQPNQIVKRKIMKRKNVNHTIKKMKKSWG